MAFDIRPVGAEHRIDASMQVEGGYRLECMCGWVSPICPHALGMFDAWEQHVTDADRR